MALDYSKLSTDELEAIANDDFTKLSNRTLRALTNEPEPKSITDNIKDFGKATASLADTGLNAVTGMLDYAAYPLARAFGRSPEQATQETTSPKDVIGRGLGITQDPAYQSELSRRMMAGVGQGIENYAVKPLASATGLPEQDVSNMVGSAMLGSAPYVNRAVASTGRGVKNVASGASDIVGGAIGRGTGYIAEPGKAPVGYQVPSSRAPLRNTVMLPEDVAKFERGEMPYGQMPTEVPIQQLPRNFTERTALKLSGGEIPYQGQAARAFGERLGETYRNPVTAAIDIGSMFATGGVPLVTTARGLLAGTQGLADSILARRGLDPNLPTRLADYQSGTRPMPGVPGPVMPSQIAAQRINPVGQTPLAQAAINKSTQVTPPPPKPTATLQPPVQQPTQVASPVTQAKETLVKSDPALQRYTNDYVVPEHLEQPINNFTNGTQKNVFAMGDPGTGKSSLAGEWMAKNPTGRFELVHTGTTEKQLRNIIKNTQLNEKTLILADEIGKLSPKMQEMISKEVGKLPNVQVLYTSNLPDVAKVHKSISGNPGINMPLQMSAELTPAQKQAYGLSTAERFNVQNLTPEQIAEKSLQGKNFRDIKRSVTEGTKLQQEPLFEHQVMNIGLPEGVAKKIDNIVNNREGQRNIIIIDKAVFAKDPSLATSLNKLEGIGPIGENLTKDLITSKTTSPIHRIQILDKGDADKLSGLKGLIERSNETQYPTNIIVENRAGLKLDPALESRAVRITLDDLQVPVTKEQQLVEKFKNVPGYKPPSNVSQMMIGEPKATGPLEQSLVSKRSFNGDLQKYRYGTEKSPLTLEEYNHLKNSEFIDKQNTRDILMGMRPDLTEYSIWYKDKSGKIQNIQTYGNEFKKK
jgi:hypothetical protein